MPDRVVSPLREARRTLHDGLRQLQFAAGAVQEAEPAIALGALDDALRYLQAVYLPIAHAEEFTMFPAIDGVLGSIGSTEVMVAQHASIGAMVSDLAHVTEAARAAQDVSAHARYFLPLLFGIYALIRAHLEAEDDIYLSLLDQHLSESQVGVIVENLGRIARATGDRPE